MKTALLLIGCIICSYLAGAIGSIFTFQNIPIWYAGLTKPPLNPPNWIFGPVWGTLYTMMGVAIFLVLNKGLKTPGVSLVLGVFIAQLLLNTLWSIVFFGLKQTFCSIPVIVALWGTILVFIIISWHISKTASILMIPYILWVSFASYLNVGVYWVNK